MVKTKTTLILINLLLLSIVVAYHVPIGSQTTVSASPDPDLYYVNVSVTKANPVFVSTDQDNYFNLNWTDRWLSLDGDDYLETPYDPAFDLNVFTVEIWFKSTYTGTTSTFHPIVCKKYEALPNWSYKKKITIQENAGQDLTGYQIKLTVHYGSGTDSGSDIYLNEKCRSDFGDVRFADSGGRLIPYWIEEKVDGDYAVFWVKVPSIPANGITNIYVYYGNPDAAYDGDGEQVFEFFDDFEDGVIDSSKWSFQGLASYEETGGALVLEANENTWNDYDTGAHASLSRELSGYHVYVDVEWVERDQDLAQITLALKNSTGRIARCGMEDAWVGDSGKRTAWAEGGEGYSSDRGTEPASGRTTFEIYHYGNSYKMYYGGELILEGSGSSSLAEIVLTNTRYQSYNGKTAKYHLIYIRKYVDPEPNISSIGDEKQNGPMGWGVGWVDSNVLGAFVEDGDERNVVQLSAEEGLDGSIHQLVVVFASDLIKVYLDGVFKASTTRTISDVTGEIPLRIGYDGENYGVFDITELRLYNRTLSADEISSNNHRDLEPTRTGLIIWYEFTNISNQVIDVTWNGHDAEIHGDPQQLTETVTKIVYEGVSLQIWQKGGDVILVDSLSSGSNENEIWDIVDTSWTVDSTSHTFYYWDHLKISLYPQISKPYTQSLTSDNYATVTYTSYGSNFTANVWINETTPYVWADRGGNVYWSTTTSASTSVHRWATPGPITLEGINQPASSSATYYEQLKVTWHLEKAHANFSDTTSSNYFNATGQQFNGSLTLTGLYTGHDLTDWIDYQSTITISSLSSGSSSTHKWISGGESYVVENAGSYTFTYYEYVKQYVGSRILDADGDDDIKEAISLIKIQNAWNGSIIQLQPGDLTGWIHYNITHRVYRVKWRGIWVDLRANQSWNPTTPNYKFNFTIPDVWLLGDSEIEWYLKSSSGSEVYTWVWSENTETLVVIQGKNRGDEVYFYYGGFGKSPQYVYVDGGLVENYALEEDPSLQILHIPFPAERVDLDFSGASREAETSVSQLTGMVQQIMRQLDLLRYSFVNITQRGGPAIRVPTIDLRAWITSWLKGAVARVLAFIDAYSPIKAPLLLPLLTFAGSFALLYLIARKLGLKRPEHPPPAAGETIVVVKRERASLTSVLAKSAATSLIAALITYLVLPRIFPAHFAQPSPLQLTIAAMVLASVLVSLVAWMAQGRAERYRGEKA